MNIYFDTEFTGLHKDTSLISIGCVTDTGETFYAEFQDYNRNQCDDWIQENVISKLHLINHISTPASVTMHEPNNSLIVCGDTAYITKEFKRWLSGFDSIQFISDVCHYDFVLLIDLFGTAFDLPKNISPYCHDINQDIAAVLGISDEDAFNISRKELLSNPFTTYQHNALDDAYVVKDIYQQLKSVTDQIDIRVTPIESPIGRQPISSNKPHATRSRLFNTPIRDDMGITKVKH